MIDKKIRYLVWLIPCILLLIALFVERLPGVYYDFLRLTLFVICVLFIIDNYVEHKSIGIISLIFIAIGIIYNPIKIINLKKDIWLFVNAFTIFPFAILLYFDLKRNHSENIRMICIKTKKFYENNTNSIVVITVISVLIIAGVLSYSNYSSKKPRFKYHYSQYQTKNPVSVSGNVVLAKALAGIDDLKSQLPQEVKGIKEYDLEFTNIYKSRNEILFLFSFKSKDKKNVTNYSTKKITDSLVKYFFCKNENIKQVSNSYNLMILFRDLKGNAVSAHKISMVTCGI